MLGKACGELWLLRCEKIRVVTLVQGGVNRDLRLRGGAVGARQGFRRVVARTGEPPVGQSVLQVLLLLLGLQTFLLRDELSEVDF